MWKWPKGHFVSELTDLFIHLNILDFGFARFADVESLLKTICGSFIYTAPELIAGRQEYSGYLTDCWSIGVILYCMLCRKLPFSKDDLMQMANGRGLLQGLDFPSHISHGNLLFFFCLHSPILFCYSFKVFTILLSYFQWNNRHLLYIICLNSYFFHVLDLITPLGSNWMVYVTRSQALRLK